MARYDYNWSCNGCGSGTSCSFQIYIEGTLVRDGTTQVSGSVECNEENKLGAIVGIIPYGVNDVAFSNGVQFYPEPVSHNECIDGDCISVNGIGFDECSTPGTACSPASNGAMLFFVATAIGIAAIVVNKMKEA